MAETNGVEPEGAWAKLRRRKVVQWGLAYVAGGWGLLQGLDYVGGAFGWPEQVQRLAILAFVVGLPIAIVVAWFHGDRGQQSVSGTELAILAVLLAIGGGLFAWAGRTPDVPAVGGRASAASPAPAAEATDKSIAVLPFVNLSSDPEQDYFSDGLAEQVLDLLARIPDLRVIARTSSFSFRHQDADIATIAQKLGVSHVLEGSVRKSGARVRITAQLVRAADSSQIWSETFDRELKDIFAIQDEIAAAVVRQLTLTLLGGSLPARRTTASTEAYDLYLKGQYLDARRANGDREAALQFYERAVKLDPRFAPAWAGIARMYARSALENEASADWAKARDAANRALEAEPDSADAFAALAWIKAYQDWDWAGARADIDRALDLAPGNARVLSTAGSIHFYVKGDWARGLELQRRAITLDPYRLASHNNLAWSLLYAGQLQESWAVFETARTLSVDPAWTEYPFGLLLLARGEPGAALERMRNAVGSLRLAGLALAHHALGESAQANEMLRQLEAAEGGPDEVLLAEVNAYCGNTDAAQRWLERAYRQHSPDLVEIRGHPLLKNLEPDPRYQAFLRDEMKLPGS